MTKSSLFVLIHTPTNRLCDVVWQDRKVILAYATEKKAQHWIDEGVPKYRGNYKVIPIPDGWTGEVDGVEIPPDSAISTAVPNHAVLIELDRRSRYRAMATARKIKNQAGYGCAQWVSDAVQLARGINRAIVRRARYVRAQNEINAWIDQS